MNIHTQQSTFVALIEAACRDSKRQARGWPQRPRTDAMGTWLSVLNAESRPRAQGWKLHVSASVLSAPDVLARSLPVLLAEDASFKVAASPLVLAQLNQGDAGLSQVAKFITVYPNDDDQAVRLAVALDAVTRGLGGPAIPSDRLLAPGSLVHYRYGGFGSQHLQLSEGGLLPALTTPDGDLVPDRRVSVYRAPEWASDPFAAAGVSIDPPEPAATLGGRYRLVSRLHRSARGEVHLAIDLLQAGLCVLKRAYMHATVDHNGHDARDRLRHEAHVLARLAPSPVIPRVHELLELDGGDVVLAMEDVDGRPLQAHFSQLVADGRHVSAEQVVAWGRELAQVLGWIHAQGLVYRDLKPSNVIVAPDGRLRLIDFEMAHAPDDDESGPIFGKGTPGYMSPQQEAGQPPSVADDIYALGAVLYYAATGAEPGHSPTRRTLLDRPIALLNPAVRADLAHVIARCLDADPGARYQTMAAVDDALAKVATAPAEHARRGDEPTFETERTARRRAAGLAKRLGDSLCATAQPAADGTGVTWVNSHRLGLPIPYRTLDVGCAGIVLGLAEVVSEIGEPSHRAILEEATRWLSASAPPPGAPVAGLYVGEAGIGAALLRAGQVLGDRGLLDAAADRGRALASLPCVSPDLFNGAAGRLRFQLILWDATHDPEHLEAAVATGDWLLGAAESDGQDGLRWPFPAGLETFGGKAFLGYSHGAAGVADVLLDLYAASGEHRFADASRSAGRWLVRQAVPTLDDGSGLDWPAVQGGARRGGLWCHGATGIGRFFLHAAQHHLLPEAANMAARAARMAARGTRWAAPVQCHGLAGTIELLLDMYQATGERVYLAEARAHARLMESYAVERNGLLLWPSDTMLDFSPSYMIGYVGVAVCLLRLAAPERLPHQLSRAGFQHRAIGQMVGAR